MTQQQKLISLFDEFKLPYYIDNTGIEPGTGISVNLLDEYGRISAIFDFKTDGSFDMYFG